MQLTPRPEKLKSSGLSWQELHAAFGAALLSAANVDCGTVTDQESGHAKLGESLVSNLVFTRLFNRDMAWLYEVCLADYLYFCKRYITESLADDAGFQAIAWRTLVRTLRKTYRERKKELLNVQNIVDYMGNDN